MSFSIYKPYVSEILGMIGASHVKKMLEEDHDLNKITSLGDRFMNLFICELLIEEFGPASAPRLMGIAISNAHYDKVITTMTSCKIKRPGEVIEICAGLLFLDSPSNNIRQIRCLASMVRVYLDLSSDPIDDQKFNSMLERKKTERELREVSENYKGQCLERLSVMFKRPDNLYKTSFKVIDGGFEATVETGNNMSAFAMGIIKKDAEQRAFKKILDLLDDGSLL